MLNKIKKKYFEARDFPKRVDIETTSKCNLRCESCPHTYMKRRQKHIDLDIFKKIIGEIAKEKPDIKAIALHAFGEPLTNPDFFKLVSYAKNKLPKTKLEMSTNSSLLNHKINNKIINSKIDSIALWEKEDKESTYKKMEDILELLSETNKEVQIGFLVRPWDFKERCEFIKRYEKYLNENISIRLMDTHDWAGTVPRKNVLHYPRFWYIKTPCQRPFNMVVVLSNGEVVPCCVDPEGMLSGGNIQNVTIKEIWNCEKFKWLRDRMLRRKIPKKHHCYSCHYYKQAPGKVFDAIVTGASPYNTDITGDMIE